MQYLVTQHIKKEQEMINPHDPRLNSPEYNALMAHIGKLTIQLGQHTSTWPPAELHTLEKEADALETLRQQTIPSIGNCIQYHEQGGCLFPGVTCEMPATTFDDLYGCDHVIDEIKRYMCWPLLYPEKYKLLGLLPPRGCTFVGDPDIGKDILARAMIHCLAQRMTLLTQQKTIGTFLHVVCPVLLSDMPTRAIESPIHKTVAHAKKIANSTHPVMIFFDDIDALFYQKDTDNPHILPFTVTQFISLMDSIKNHEHIIVICAISYEDAIDPLILRRMRCDKLFFIPRPDQAAAKKMFTKYLLPQWGQVNPRYDQRAYIPTSREGIKKDKVYHFRHDPQRVAEYLIDRAIERIYDTEIIQNRLMQLTLKGKTPETQETTFIYFSDVISDTVIQHIVEIAKRMALDEHLEQKTPLGIETKHLFLAIEEVFTQLGKQANRDYGKTYSHLIWRKSEGRLMGKPLILKHDQRQIPPFAGDKNTNQNSDVI